MSKKNQIQIEFKVINSEFNRAMKEMGSEVTNLNKKFRLEQEQLRLNGTEKQKLESRVGYLTERYKLQQKEVRATEQQLRKAKEVFGENSKEVQQLENRLLEAQRKEAYFANELQIVSKQLADQRNKMLQLGKSMQEFGGRLQDVGKKMTDIGKDMTLKLTTPIVGVGAAASKLGIDFGRSMAEVQAVTGATGSELDSLEKTARDVGRTTNKSASEAAQGLKLMGQAGWSVSESQNNLEHIVKLSSSANIDLAKATDLAVNGLATMGKTSDETERYFDVLAKTSNSTNTDIQSLGDAFIAVGGRFNTLNVDIEEGAKSLGILAEAGKTGSEAGKSLNAVLANLTAPTGRAKKALDELGVSAFDSNGEFIGIEETLMEVEKAMDGMSTEQRNLYMSMIAGKEHTSSFTALLNGLGGRFNELENDIAGSEGALDKMYNTITDDTKGSIENLKSSIEELGLKLYENLQPTIERAIDLVQGLTDKMNELSPETQQNIVKIGLMVAAAGPLLIVLGSMSKGVGTVITVLGKLTVLGSKVTGLFGGIAGAATGAGAAIGGTTAPAWALGGALKGGALAMAPWVAGAAAVGLGAYKIYKNLQEDAIPAVELFGDEVSESTAKAVGGFLELEEEATIALNELNWGSQEVTQDMVDNISGKFEQMKDSIVGTLEEQKESAISIMTSQFETSKYLTEEEKEYAIQAMQSQYDEQIARTEEGNQRINEILQRAADQNRELNAMERIEIRNIKEGMKNDAIEVLSASEEEQLMIMERLKAESGTISATQAAETVKNAREQRNQTVAEAEAEYKERVKEAEALRKEGSKESEELADKIIADAELQRREAVGNANEQYNETVRIAKEKSGEHVNQVDWETGEIKTKWQSMRDSVTATASNLGTRLSSAWDNIRTVASNKWNNIATSIGNGMNTAKEKVSTAIENIKGFFSRLRLKFPKIEMPKLPKFEMTGKFGLNPPSVPKLSVRWNALGAIFTKPTIFDTSQGLQGVGEAGPEAVLPISKLAGMVQEVIDKERDLGGMCRHSYQTIEITVPVHLNGKQIAIASAPQMSIELEKLAVRKRR